MLQAVLPQEEAPNLFWMYICKGRDGIQAADRKFPGQFVTHYCTLVYRILQGLSFRIYRSLTPHNLAIILKV